MSGVSFDFFISTPPVSTDFSRAQVSSWGWPGSLRIEWHGGEGLAASDIVHLAQKVRLVLKVSKSIFNLG